MSRRRRLILSLMLGGALVAIIGLSKAMREPPQGYVDRFCLLDDGHRMCGIRTLTRCVTRMTGPASECEREAAEAGNADRASRKEH